jgi:hypothetical protein
MKAPNHQRVDMLCEALGVAAGKLEKPIDRVEVVGGKVLVWAGTARMTLSCAYHNGPPPTTFGGGRWQASVLKIEDEREVTRAVPSFWARTFGARAGRTAR